MLKKHINKYKTIIIIVGVALVIVLSIFIQPDSNIVTDVIEDAIKNPEVTDNEITYIYVDIKGEILNPGVYKIEQGTRLYQLLYQAGGLTPDANSNIVNQSILLKDEQSIYIPHIDEDIQTIIEIPNDETPSETGLININTADKTILESLPGIGPSSAQEIIDYREENGVFLSIEDIKNVPGIGDVTYENIKGLITV